MSKEKIREEILAMITKCEEMKADESVPLIVRTALFNSYVKLHEALYRNSTGKIN